jgi:hypothetical protein
VDRPVDFSEKALSATTIRPEILLMIAEPDQILGIRLRHHRFEVERSRPRFSTPTGRLEVSRRRRRATRI